MSEAELEAVVNEVIARFVEKMLRLARESLELDLRGFVPPGAGSREVGLLATRDVDEVVVVKPPALPMRIVARPAKPVPVVHAAEHVERLVQLVNQHPWPAKSRELQVLLGVKKDPFLRIVDLALAAGRIRRTGERSGVRYLGVG